MGAQRPRRGRPPAGAEGRLTTYRAEEVPVGERAPIIAAYRAKAGREVDGYWKKLPADADHPVFRLTR